MEGSLHKNLEDHIAGQEMNSLRHYNLVRKFILMPQALNIPDAKAAVEKECGKLEKIPDTSTKTQMAKIMVQHGRSSRSS